MSKLDAPGVVMRAVERDTVEALWDAYNTLRSEVVVHNHDPEHGRPRYCLHVNANIELEFRDADLKAVLRKGLAYLAFNHYDDDQLFDMTEA